MLNFDDDIAPAPQPRLAPATPETIRAQTTGGILSREPVHDLDVERQAMENGFRRDAAGRAVPVHIVERVTCRYSGREVFRAELGTGMSANPYLTFFVRAVESSELVVEWTDDRGERGRAAASIHVA